MEVLGALDLEGGRVVVLPLLFQSLVLVIENVFIDTLLYQNVSRGGFGIVDRDRLHQNLHLQIICPFGPGNQRRYFIDDIVLLL